MSIFGALFSGVSGLSAQAQAMGMLSDNITNVNTIGYKETVARFSTLVTSSATATSYAPGGVRSTPQQLIDKQGLLLASASPTDLAINGAGFMVVTETIADTATKFLTRAGSFTPDVDGNLKNAGGFYLRGYRYVDGEPVVGAPLVPVNIAPFQLKQLPVVTENVGFRANLKASEDVSVAAATAASTALFDITDAQANADATLFSLTVGAGGVAGLAVTGQADGSALAATIQAALRAADNNEPNITATWTTDVLTISDRLGRVIAGPSLTDAAVAEIDGSIVVTTSTYAGEDSLINMASGAITPDFTRSVEIYDSKGTSRTLTYAFLRSNTAGQWYTEVFVEPASLTTATTDGQVMRGVLAFNTNGTWDLGNTTFTDGLGAPITPIAGDYTAIVPFDTATLNIDAQAITFDWGSDGAGDGMTEFDGELNLASAEVDGAKVGQLAGIAVDELGTLTAVYDNGTTQDWYRIPVGMVFAPNYLAPHSGNVFEVTQQSGTLDDQPTAGDDSGAGLFAPSSLEASTVDLANEFSKMIITQRAFSAAARIVTTADEMLDELLRVKR